MPDMPNEFDNDENYDPENDHEVDPEEDRTPAALRRAADAGKAAKRRAAELERKVALLEAGIDTKSPVGQMFAKAYDGPLDEVKIKEAWSALGVTPATPIPDSESDPTEPEFTDDERSSTAQRQALANGAVADTPTEPDPRTAAANRAIAVEAQGGTRDDAYAAWFSGLLEAGAQGDKRVLVNKDK